MCQAKFLVAPVDFITIQPYYYNSKLFPLASHYLIEILVATKTPQENPPLLGRGALYADAMVSKSFLSSYYCNLICNF